MAEDQRILQRVLALADVQDLYERRYRRLSGGEQQRVHLARVLYQLLLARQGHDEYRVLMLDEPTASLDPRHQLHLLSAVHTLAHEENVAVLVIVHDLNLAAGCCDRLLLKKTISLNKLFNNAPYQYNKGIQRIYVVISKK